MTIRTIPPERNFAGSGQGPGRRGLLAAGPVFVKPGLRCVAAPGMMQTMDKPSREQRLAAKLRENLHRRKAQARAFDAGDKPALSKPPPKS